MAIGVKQVAVSPLAAGTKTVALPQGSKVVNFQMQGGVPTVTVVGDNANPDENRNFLLIQNNVGTQINLPAMFYIGTISSGGVWHLFEI